MKRILFICHGNICRSVMAEYILKDYCKKHNITDIYIDSAAISDEETGNPIFPPARRELEKHGIAIGNHKARTITKADYENFDIILCAEERHCLKARLVFGGDKEGKVMRMLDVTGASGNIPDPWYSDDYAATFDSLTQVCKGLAKYL